jgi:hypothetical protein
MTVQYYDRPFPLIAIVDLSPLGKSDQEAVIKYLETKYKAWAINYPSDSTKETAEELGNKGFLKFRTKPPYTLTTDEAIMLFTKCIDKFNPQAVFRSTPNTIRLQKSVINEKDLCRVIDDLTIQQDAITLSNIWKLANVESRIAYATRSHDLNRRICREVVEMPEEYIGKRKFEEKMKDLDGRLDAAVEHDKVQAQLNFANGKYRQ